MKLGWWAGAVLGLFLAGCPSDSDSDADDDAATPEATRPDAGSSDAGEESKDAGSSAASDAGSATVDPAAKVGTFTIRLVEPKPASGSSAGTPGFTSFNGKVFDAVVPEETVWDLDSEASGCKLLKPRVPFCDPACSQGVCVEDDKCAPNANAKSVGTVTLSGLKRTSGTGDITVEPVVAAYSTPGDVNLPYPAFAEGDALRLHAAGGAGSAFDIEAKGIAPLELSAQSFALKTGAALQLSWKAPGKSDLGRISVKLDVSHHGGSKGKIECDVADTGSLSISADLVTKLLKLGVAGYPTILVSRVSTGHVNTPAGRVELRVVSDLERPVEIDGLTSCTDSSDCAAGKTCQTNLTCK